MSIMTRGLLRLKADFHKLSGNHDAYDEAIVQVASDKVRSLAERAIKDHDKKQLAKGYDSVSLSSLADSVTKLNERQKTLIETSVVPIVEQCRQNGLHLAFSTKDGFDDSFSAYLGTVPAQIKIEFSPVTPQ